MKQTIEANWCEATRVMTELKQLAHEEQWEFVLSKQQQLAQCLKTFFESYSTEAIMAAGLYESIQKLNAQYLAIQNTCMAALQEATSELTRFRQQQKVTKIYKQLISE